MEILKSCKRCNSQPKISRLVYNADSIRNSYSVICCTTITSKQSESDAIWKWNVFNAEAESTFKFNRELNKWEHI